MSYELPHQRHGDIMIYKGDLPYDAFFRLPAGAIGWTVSYQSYAVAEAARLELGGEIRVVIAPETVASTFALAVRERPYPVLDGRLEISPWVPNGLIERCGVLFIVFEPPGPGRHPVPGGPAEMIWRTVPALDGKGCRGNDKAP